MEHRYSHDPGLDQLCVNTIRFLSIDAVEEANSGHPGLPMGAAPMAYVLWTRRLRHNPANPDWFNRDRFVLSAGHGSMVLYSLLHLTGYDLPLAQIRQFRRWGSITPGHPERGVTRGVEVTTGPLGQGFANAVGLAIAEAHLGARFNRPGHEIVDHRTYVLASDGDLMEGISSEAASMAGHLGLAKLTCLYDDNRVSLAGATGLSFSEDVAQRFSACGWHATSVADGNNLEAIEQALLEAEQETDRPSLIVVRTHLGYGSPGKQDTFEAHGSPLGPEEVRRTKQNLGWPVEPAFHLPDESLRHFRQCIVRGQELEQAWEERFAAYRREFAGPAGQLEAMLARSMPAGWASALPRFSPEKKLATRAASGKILAAVADRLPGLIGGSGDLNPSTQTVLPGAGDFQNPRRSAGDTQGSAGGPWGYEGRNLHFGVREHAMGAILNGLAAHGGLIPFGGTFLNFSDYMRAPIRLAAMMSLQAVYVFTHDSIALGEDGPTHEPIEQLLSLRAVPGLHVIRPADANETVIAWQMAIQRRDGPTALVLSRQNLPVFDLERFPQIPEGVRRGGYLLSGATGDKAAATLVATGSEVHLALAAQAELANRGTFVAVASMPCWNVFQTQPEDYRHAVVSPDRPWLAIEAGTTLGWRNYLEPSRAVLGVDRFGASAPGEVVLHQYGFNLDNVCGRVLALLGRPKERPDARRPEKQ